MNPRVKQVEYKSKYKLILTFENDEVKEFDFSAYLEYPVYCPLIDESFSATAGVYNGTVVWSDDIDFDPDRLYLESRTLTAV